MVSTLYRQELAAIDDKRHKMREKILEEILTTERNYVKTLDDIIQVQKSISHRFANLLTLFTYTGVQAALRGESKSDAGADQSHLWQYRAIAQFPGRLPCRA